MLALKGSQWRTYWGDGGGCVRLMRVSVQKGEERLFQKEMESQFGQLHCYSGILTTTVTSHPCLNSNVCQGRKLPHVDVGRCQIRLKVVFWFVVQLVSCPEVKDVKVNTSSCILCPDSKPSFRFQTFHFFPRFPIFTRNPSLPP